MAKASVDWNKLRRDVQREMRRIGTVEAEVAITNADRVAVGDFVIAEMKAHIAKGISPIFGNGRFPGYKAVESGNKILRSAKNKGARKAKRLRAKARDAKQAGYPFTMRKKFPGKRPRPVNLRLSGRFLSNLETRPMRGGTEVGFWDDMASKLESGHRVGVNDQPSRPIIPQGSEVFTRPIYTKMVNFLRATIIKRMESRMRRK